MAWSTRLTQEGSRLPSPGLGLGLGARARVMVQGARLPSARATLYEEASMRAHGATWLGLGLGLGLGAGLGLG
eukprot:scaffold109575_cov24-Phaeocystis_antarctica.AAC.1